VPKVAVLDESCKPVLDRLRKVAMALPGVVETLTYGNPTFKANGKAFAVLDRYKGEYCIWIRCDGKLRAKLLKDGAFFPSPYDKAKQAVCRKLDGLNWKEFGPQVKASYDIATML
jgi:hypothetical protein